MSLLTTLKMTATEQSELADLFSRIDVDGDGYLSPEELRNGLSEVCGALQLQTTDIKEMIKAMDTDGNGQIDF